MRAAHALQAILLCTSASSCIATDPPGEQVGVFDIVAELEENTCGDQAVIADDSTYAIELRRDERSVYWQVLGGQPMVGRYDAPGHLHLEVDSVIPLYSPDDPQGQAPLDDPEDFFTFDPDAAFEPRRCMLIQSEQLEASFGAGLDVTARDAGVADGGSATHVDEGAPDLVGTHHLELRASTDSDCSAAMVAQGGPFVALPCEIRYALTGGQRE